MSNFVVRKTNYDPCLEILLKILWLDIWLISFSDIQYRGYHDKSPPGETFGRKQGGTYATTGDLNPNFAEKWQKS